jgi:mannan endo-1,4-beta-mannosidase
MTVGRTWAFNHNLPSFPAAKRSEYYEKEFRALDMALVLAAKYNVRMILGLGNFWSGYTGPEEYLKWAGDAGAQALSQSKL